MKNKLFAVTSGVFIFFLVSASNATAQKFEVGNNVVGLGLGLGSTYGYTYGSSSPAISAQYEHGNWSVGGPGTISLGAFLAYKSYSYEGVLPYYSYSQKWSYTILGFRSAYHYNGLDAPAFDPYGGIMLSFDIASSSYTSNNPSYDYLYSGGYGSVFRITMFIGGRYYFSNQWAGYAELGFGNAILTLGAAYKF